MSKSNSISCSILIGYTRPIPYNKLYLTTNIQFQALSNFSPTFTDSFLIHECLYTYVVAVFEVLLCQHFVAYRTTFYQWHPVSVIKYSSYNGVQNKVPIMFDTKSEQAHWSSAILLYIQETQWVVTRPFYACILIPISHRTGGWSCSGELVLNSRILKACNPCHKLYCWFFKPQDVPPDPRPNYLVLWAGKQKVKICQLRCWSCPFQTCPPQYRYHCSSRAGFRQSL